MTITEKIDTGMNISHQINLSDTKNIKNPNENNSSEDFSVNQDFIERYINYIIFKIGTINILIESSKKRANESEIANERLRLISHAIFFNEILTKLFSILSS